MHWFEYRTCNYFFTFIQAPSREQADARLRSVFGRSLDEQCSHCQGPRWEEITELSAEDAAHFDELSKAHTGDSESFDVGSDHICPWRG